MTCTHDMMRSFNGGVCPICPPVIVEPSDGMRFAPDANTVDEIERAGGYPVIYADPPWTYNDHSCNGGVGKVYKTLSAEAIARLPVARLAGADAVMFLWGTYPKLPEVLALIPRWGFTFKSIAFQWIKTRGVNVDGSGRPFLGLGRWTRGNSEPCFLCVRGKPERISASVSQLIFTAEQGGSADDVFVAPVGKHSAKPPETRDKIVQLMGESPRLELFAREKVAGWDCWGNEVPADVVMRAEEA